ncbi:MAG: class I SAM-dependent methyltransferase family protein [Thermoplasmata archaeon]
MRPFAKPADRVRRRLAVQAGTSLAPSLPDGYQRLGRVLVLRLPDSLRPHFALIGRLWQEELGVATVLRVRGPVVGESREPDMELLAGRETETEVIEFGIRYRLDVARVLFARGNRTERARAGHLIHPGEVVVDLFAGIGYFSLPAAVVGRARRVYAVEKNPVAYSYLVQNIDLNRAKGRVVPMLGDNRAVPLPSRVADHVFLGYLPSSVDWVPLAVERLRPEGGTLHVHLVVDARDGLGKAERAVEEAVIVAGGRVGTLAPREVKPYGPGRQHVVVDVTVVPPG